MMLLCCAVECEGLVARPLVRARVVGHVELRSQERRLELGNHLLGGLLVRRETISSALFPLPLTSSLARSHSHPHPFSITTFMSILLINSSLHVHPFHLVKAQ